jgi:hypothetical protein
MLKKRLDFIGWSPSIGIAVVGIRFYYGQFVSSLQKCNYTNNEKRMDYACFRQQGYLIGRQSKAITNKSPLHALNVLVRVGL